MVLQIRANPLDNWEFHNRICEIQLKMKPLMTCQRALSLFLRNPSDKSHSKREKLIKITAILFCVFCTVVYFVFSVITFMNMVSTDLEAALYPLAQLLPIGALLNIFLIAFFQRCKIFEVFIRLTEIYKICK